MLNQTTNPRNALPCALQYHQRDSPRGCGKDQLKKEGKPSSKGTSESDGYGNNDRQQQKPPWVCGATFPQALIGPKLRLPPLTTVLWPSTPHVLYVLVR